MAGWQVAWLLHRVAPPRCLSSLNARLACCETARPLPFHRPLHSERQEKKISLPCGPTALPLARALSRFRPPPSSQEYPFRQKRCPRQAALRAAPVSRSAPKAMGACISSGTTRSVPVQPDFNSHASVTDVLARQFYPPSACRAATRRHPSPLFRPRACDDEPHILTRMSSSCAAQSSTCLWTIRGCRCSHRTSLSRSTALLANSVRTAHTTKEASAARHSSCACDAAVDSGRTRAQCLAGWCAAARAALPADTGSGRALAAVCALGCVGLLTTRR